MRHPASTDSDPQKADPGRSLPISVTETPPYGLRVRTPYHPLFVRAAHHFRAQWQREGRSWLFPPSTETGMRLALARIFGYGEPVIEDGTDDLPTPALPPSLAARGMSK